MQIIRNQQYNEPTGRNYVAIITRCDDTHIEVAFGNRKIETIKWVREVTGWPLAIAKDFVDRAEREPVTIHTQDLRSAENLGIVAVKLYNSPRPWSDFEFVIA